MLPCFSDQQQSTAIKLLSSKDFKDWVAQQSEFTKQWLQQIDFQAKSGQVALLPDNSGQLTIVLAGIDEQTDFWQAAHLVERLPAGDYHFDVTEQFNLQDLALSWALASYCFDRYKHNEKTLPRLRLPANIDSQWVSQVAEGIYLVRDLINTPPQDMAPSNIAEQAKKLAKAFGAQCEIIVGDKLLKHNYPTIHAVGRASCDQPRLIDLRWGQKQHPRVTLVGKGVSFDTGGLDIKTTAGMALMKKDMGGAAHVMGLAHMIMAQQLPLQLRVLIPAVENAIAGNAMHPSDIITTRSTKTVEVTNTDAEGRLILCDALTEAASEKPELIIDFATLTGAARVAVGTDIAAMFANSDDLANDILKQATQHHDPIWRLPLHQAYFDMMKSPIADMKNSADSGYAGAITAALFLQQFVPNDIPWLHFDVMAWNVKSKAGRPIGGEALALRAVFAYLQQRFN